MLYVFQMDVGQMLTFDTSLLTNTVSRLQQEIERKTEIAVDKQILLVSGGHSLKLDQTLMTYGAGTDTNPVFLFSKAAIESQEPPSVRSAGLPRDFLGALREGIADALSLPPTFETAIKRTKVACQLSDSANKILAFCNAEFGEQHLQHQGWGTVVANLEEIAQALQKTEAKFTKTFTAFLPSREQHFSMLESFSETLELLMRIPLLKSLKEGEEEKEANQKSSEEGVISFVASTTEPPSLLEWITTQGHGQSIEMLQQKCYDDLRVFNGDMVERWDQQVKEVVVQVTNDPHHMKELVGIERRLSELEKRLNEAKKIAKEQSDMAQGFIHQQSRLSSTNDPTVLNDLCKTHKQQLLHMQERQQRMEILQNNFRKSKQEMSTNIYQRLGWVMHVETQISKLDSDLIYHMKMLRILECNLELLNQVKLAPQVYADMVVEAARRRIFSKKFSEWAENLVEDSGQVYALETERRKQFARKLGEHFLLDTLFKGFEDMPPSFAAKSPKPFDVALPEITMDDVAYLRQAVPELEEFLSPSLEAGCFPKILLGKAMLESPRMQVITPQSQSSQTDWCEELQPGAEPCVIKATEAPPTKFTLPELQESLSTEYLPAVSSLTETTRVSIDSQVKPSCEPGSVKPTSSSESSNSAPTSETNVSESGVIVHSVKTQTKTNSTNTDSTSPLSSNEFATADFYFEDSMPSPMADSPLAKKEGKKLENGNDSEMVISLQTQLSEKMARIEELEQQLKRFEKESSPDDTSTLVGTTDLSDQALASDSGGAISSESCAIAESKSDGPTDSSKSMEESEVKLEAKEDGPDQESSVRIKKLEWELELANGDVAKFKQSLFDSESKFSEHVEECAKTSQDRENQISSLEGQVNSLNEDLEKAKKLSEDQDKAVNSLKSALSLSQTKCDGLEQEVKKGEDSLERIKRGLLELREKLKVDLPSLKHILDELKASVVNNKSEMNTAVSSALGLVEKNVSFFNTSVLADINAEHAVEIEKLKAEIQQLSCDLNQIRSDNHEKELQVKNLNVELASRIDTLREEHNQKYEKLKTESDAAIKDSETKHALELELELDKCKAEFRESSEEAERYIERLTKMKDGLQEELEETKAAADKQIADLKAFHSSTLEDVEKKRREDKETAALSSQQLHSELEEKLLQCRAQVTDLEANLESVKATLTAEKEQALATLKEQLETESDGTIAELKAQLDAQKSHLSEVLEEKQLLHAQKLTELKTQFDMEREKLLQQIQELSKYKNWTRDEVETQTHQELTHVDTQTDTDLIADAMTNSETQTGLELLAEVISLTSSASYGSEEMIAHKQPSTVTDDKESKETLEASNKLQLTIDDLNVQLANAQEKIALLESELVVMSDKKAVSENSGGAPLSAMSHSQYQEMMQSSSIGASFMVMDKELSSSEIRLPDDKAARAKDNKIAQLEKKLMEMSMTASEREVTSDKVSIRGCDKGDLVLLCLDERHDQYVVFTVGTNLHFLHSESLECLGLKSGGDASCRKSWILAEVVDKEYCLAKKPNNRFRVPQGTCFYRVKCKPWKSEFELPRPEVIKHSRLAKSDHGTGARPKKSDKK